MSTTYLPALFIGHGSPMNTLEINRYTESWRNHAAS
ncbi:4,5-DOPA dioxygenase extradiol, partial [Klebsiella aerogenes]|nr:4,5-DOPA dioxygenase extradiol [Klebsiella aerogenes]